jgi:hypothetical protein
VTVTGTVGVTVGMLSPARFALSWAKKFNQIQPA